VELSRMMIPHLLLKKLKQKKTLQQLMCNFKKALNLLENRVRRKHIANKLYNLCNFMQHHDNELSDVDE